MDEAGRTILVHQLDAAAESALAAVVAELGLTRAAAHAGVEADSLQPDVAVLSAARDEDAAFRLAAALAAGGTRVLVVGRKDPDLILRALRSGACEFVVSGDHDELRRAVRRRFGSDRAEGARGSVVAVFGAKGGTGATSVATNLAGALAQGGERVCLLDVDPNLGDVLSALDMPPGFSTSDLLSNLRRLDRELLDGSVQRHRSGVAVLAPSDDQETATAVRPEAIASALGFLRAHYRLVVADGLHGFGEASLGVLDASDLVLLVTTQEVTAVRDAGRCLDLFRRIGYGDEKIQVVLNRYDRASRVTPDVVVETLGVPVAATLANDHRAISDAIGRGDLVTAVAPRSQLARDLAGLATLVAPEAAGRRERRRSFFGRIFAGRAADEAR
jgi:pilus assembly protein CpaE